MSAPAASRNLLFGMLALQMGFCRNDQLVRALDDWMQYRSLPLGEVLVKLGILTPKRRELLVQAVDEYLAEHGPCPELSVAEVQTGIQQRVQATQQFLEEGGRRLAELSQSLPNDPDKTQEAIGPLPSAPAAAERFGTAGGGRFRVLGLHAKGGLGQVMLAEDQQLGRRVALKEIQPEMSADPIRRERFLAEAEITGALEHPGIVPVYALGAHPDGRPYYVMRFIRGDDLAAAIEEFHGPAAARRDPGRRAVDLRRLLRRFTDVCQAVQYAHSRGVLHRDLKPGNVMLGKYGETLVVDWGLAKLIGRPAAAGAGDESTVRLPGGSGSSPTLAGRVVGTPGYMSPEQAAGKLDELGPASDVYSLGATLYCLLTGRAPFQTQTGVLERVKAGDFPSPRMINPQVPRPLEAICLKAMALAPQDRYASPGQIVEDLEHWLADEPVSVYRETCSERLSRWTRRHRTWFQAGLLSLAVIAVVSAAAAVLVLRAWQREAMAWREAGTRFVQARQAVDRWLTGVSEALRYYPLLARTREALLERAAADYERFVRQASDDLELMLEQGRTQLRLGHLRRQLRDSQAAEKSYTAARALFESLHASHPHVADCRIELANCHTALGLLAAETGKLAQAEASYQTAIAVLEALPANAAESVPTRQALTTALLNRGELLAETGRHQAAEGDLRRCIALLEKLAGEWSASPKPQVAADGARPRDADQGADHQSVEQVQTTLTSAHDLLGRSLLDQGRYEEAARELAAAASLSSRLAQQQPDHPAYRESRAATQIYLAGALRVLGRFEEEAQAYRQATEDYTALCAALPGVTLLEESLAITRMDLGNLLAKLGRVQEAETELNRACEALEELMRAHPDIPRYRDAWACCCDNLGDLLRERGKSALAETLLEGAIAAFQTLVADGRSDAGPGVVKYTEGLALCRSHLGQLLHSRGQHAEADQAFAAALEGLSPLAEKSPANQDRLAFVHQCRGILLADMGKEAESLAEFRRARELRQQLAGVPEAAAEHRAHLAWLLILCPLQQLRDPLEAVRLAKALAAEVPRNAEYQNLLGAALCRSGDHAGAIERLREASRLRGSEHAGDAFWLAIALRGAGQAEAAKQAYDRGQRWLDSNLPQHQELRRLQREAAQLLGIPRAKSPSSDLPPKP